MKVYFVVKEPSERTINHFVESLGKSLEARGCEVVYGLKRLWTDNVLECDVVHFQWPEFIFKPCTNADVARMKNRLEWLKEHGVKIFCTCHNLKPHAKKDEAIKRLYDVLYTHADTIVHLGNYSRELLQKQYPNERHVVVPHHIYNNMLTFAASQQEARQKLHLPNDRKVVLCFGKFRNDKERLFVLNLKKRVENSTLYTLHSTLFLMPGFYRESLHTWNPKKLLKRLYHTVCYRLSGIRFSNEVIPDDLMQCYFCAADAVLIQRLDILNSGNLPMAFAAGKVVAGPDIGNVGEILKETGNMVFKPDDIEAAALAVRVALKMGPAIGKNNKEYAEEHWSSGVIAKKLLEYYNNNER